MELRVIGRRLTNRVYAQIINYVIKLDYLLALVTLLVQLGS